MIPTLQLGAMGRRWNHAAPSGGGGVSVPTANAILNFNGADGSTTITDDTGLHTWTAFNTATLSTTQKKFGTASGKPGSAGAFNSASHADWAFPNGTDFTVAAWIWIPSSFSGLTGMIFMSNVSSGFQLAYRAGKLALGREGIAWDRQSTTSIPLDQWVHVEAGRASSTDYGFINGVLELTGANTHNYAQGDASWGAKSGGSAALVSGHLDSGLVNKGTCLHTANFTPPSGPYSL